MMKGGCARNEGCECRNDVKKDEEGMKAKKEEAEEGARKMIGLSLLGVIEPCGLKAVDQVG